MIVQNWQRGILLASLAVVPGVWAQGEGEFDPEILKQRGIDPSLATFFRESARFTSGTHRVSLTVNGHAKGKVDVQFTDEGELCFNPTLLDAAGLNDPDSGAQECRAFLQKWPLTQIDFHPDKAAINLIVPPEALRESERNIAGYQTGGRAALLNYEMTGIANHYASGQNYNFAAATELGFNAGDWITRSRQLYNSSSGDNGKIQHLDAYVQRTFASLGAVLQAGQIQMVNPVLNGAQINGLQWMNEQALAQQGATGRVAGIAQGQARVEVRQASNLIFTTVVPAGPFVLTEIPMVSRRQDLDVTVIEADGSQHQFTVSAAMAGAPVISSGYAFSIGQVRNVSGAAQEPLVASAGWSGATKGGLGYSSGAMVATDYTAFGAGLSHPLWHNAMLQGDVLTSRDARDGAHGVLSRLSFSQRLGQNLAADMSASYQTPGYRDLLDMSFSKDDDNQRIRIREQLDARVSWANEWLGNLSAGVSQSSYSDDTSNRRAIASWSMNYKYASVSFSAERDLGSKGRNNQTNYNSNALYVSLNLPLGDSPRITASVRNIGGGHRLGINASDSPSDAFSYRVGSELDTRSNTTTVSAGASMIPRYAQLDVGYYGDANKQNSMTAGLRGGVVVHGEGITATPYPVKDTFAIVNVGEVPGVKLNTSSGPVWTNGHGQAVVPQLNAWGKNSVEVAPASLPRNVEVNEGVSEIKAGRGAVQRINFAAKVTRRVLLTVTTAQGKPIAEGALATDGQNVPVGMVERNGELFLSDVNNNDPIWLAAPHLPRCRVHFTLPEQLPTEGYYETLAATCQ